MGNFITKIMKIFANSSESNTSYIVENEGDLLVVNVDDSEVSIDDVIIEENNTIFTKNGNKMALLIGVNYISDNDKNNDLGGCVNDVINLQKDLIDKMHFNDDNISTLINKTANKDNIIKELEKLILFSNTNENSEIWLSYSGHGGGKFSISESDNQSEFICPSDYKISGLIHDSWLKENFVKKLHKSTKCFVLMDCCNSGSNINLPFCYNKDKVECDDSLCKIIKISGSKDNQTSADYYDRESQSYQGALSNSFLKTLSLEEDILTHYIELKKSLQVRRFTQVPDLTYSDSILVNYKLF
jgi:hypothetical protein